MLGADYASICLLSYERPKFVRQTIASAIKNAGHPLELIVHDDGSNEETVEVLREFHRNGLISLLMLNAPGNNEGQGVALRRMFAAATGDPIVKMDQDLELEPDWLKRCVALLRANWETAQADGGPEADPLIGALGLFKYEHHPVHHEDMVIEAHVSDGIEWEEHEDFVGSSMVIPRAAYEEFGPFDIRSTAFAEDAVFKQTIAARDGWCNALFPDDLATNFGFGLGKSTVAVEGADGQPEPAAIKPGPLLIKGDL